VDNAPLASDGIFHIVGGTGATNAISFSSAVLNPVIAIWSLGQSGTQASFVFNAPFTVEAGGPSAEYNGGPLGGVSPVVTGNESNGVIQFHGTFNSLTFTNPQAENWYGFAVGVAGVPEPASWALMILGFGGVGSALRTRRRMAATAA
ncbi:MAG: PEPxxWA-CTERM sorting domain-containing protein, partial [Phenylobacterium sp.]